MKVELTIIIVNWNGESILSDCLKSIVQNPPSVTYEIIVFDNASTDNSVKWFQSAEAKMLLRETNFTLIESKENLGFGKANNLVIEQTNSPFVFLLNPDTVIKPKAIDNLLKTLQSNKKIGAVAPKLLNKDGTIQHSVWVFPLTALRLIVEGFHLYHVLPSKIRGKWLFSKHWTYDERRKVPLFSGAAIMAKREMIKDVGAFDADFYMFGEDQEWCVRINRKGWDLFFEPTAEVFHLGGQSAIQRWDETERRLKEEEGFLKFQQHCLPPSQVMRNSLARMLVLQFYRARRILKRQDTKYLSKVISLQKQSLKKSFNEIFNNK
ncbi:MAG: glycosyltransferase family 2 protein [Acidobacteriota bacterium]|nr:glycosyltransferase family 2 protein [Acidobacteriota bacterium]